MLHVTVEGELIARTPDLERAIDYGARVTALVLLYERKRLGDEASIIVRYRVHEGVELVAGGRVEAGPSMTETPVAFASIERAVKVVVTGELVGERAPFSGPEPRSSVSWRDRS